MITLTQLYELGKNINVDIFDGLLLPDDSPLDRETVVNSIMERCGLNIPMYADVNVMRSAINLWSAKNQYTFIHIGKIYLAEYSPIENTDRYDSIVINHNRDVKDDTKTDGASTEKAETTNHNTNDHTGNDRTDVEETTSADNVDDYQPKDKTESVTNYNSSISDNGGGTLNKETSTKSNNNKVIDEDEKTETIQHLHGNIGVSTNTQLQTEEYELLSKYNPYDFIAGLFENSLTLFVF